MELSLEDRFSLEQRMRSIDSSDDIGFLRGMCKTLLSAWYSERARAQQLIKGQIHANLD